MLGCIREAQFGDRPTAASIASLEENPTATSRYEQALHPRGTANPKTVVKEAGECNFTPQKNNGRVKAANLSLSVQMSNIQHQS